MSDKVENLEWKSVGGISNNQVLHCDGFYISYARPNAMSALPMFDSDGGVEETALCVPREERKGEYDFLILNGDYRAAYERLAPGGAEPCIAFFNKNIAHASSWSDRRRGGAS